MDNIFSLIHSLTSAEWQSFQNYLSCFSTHESSDVKHLQLARILRGSKECPEEKQCRRRIYGTKDDIRIDVLKSRLKEKVLDFLLSDISCDKKNELDEADYAIVRINKKSAQLRQLFYSKKRTSLIYDLLNEIIFLSREYEQYSILVEHLRLKKALFGWKSGKKEFDEINAEMKKYWKFILMENQSEHLYYELLLQYEYTTKPDREKVCSFLKKSISELDRYYSETRSPLIKYHRKFMELGYYNFRENHSKARSICLELIDIVRGNKSVYRRQRIGVVYDNLSRCEFYLGHYQQAAEWAREAQKYFNTGSENYCIALEQEFYALFAMKQFKEAEDIANKMISSATRKELGEFRFAKYNFLLANALFGLNRHEDALNLLSKEMEISRDKAGWETGIRILRIMTLVDMLKMDEASLAVFSLKQFFKYNDKKGNTISPRDKKILNLLTVAEKAGFLFSTLNGSTDKYMISLCSNDKDLKWEPFTHEVIPFHEWFAGKMKVDLRKYPKTARENREKEPVQR